MRLTPENYAVSDLIDLVENGNLALPEFQRAFIWRPPQVAELLRTYARRWPAGTFLLLAVEGKPDFATKPLKTAPPLKSPTLLILDGQQRTTALYQALCDRAEEIFFVRIGEVTAHGGFDDEHLEYLKRSKFAKAYPTLKDQARERVVPVDVLMNDSQWQKWLRYIEDEDEQDALVAARSAHLPGFKDYDIPIVRLPHDVPLPAIAKIFETLNKTGTPLATFDLMVARLYPYDFKLRDKWIEARDANPELAEFGLDTDRDGVEILKIIALYENIRQRAANVKMTVKGVRESDVLTLGPDSVISHWDDAVAAYTAAVQFLKEKCGVVRRSLLPSQTMLLPLAHLLSPKTPKRAGLGSDLERWFWASSFMQSYSQGANTKAVSDAQLLAGWQANPDSTPTLISNFRLDSELLKDGRRRNEMLLRGLPCRTITLNARDWLESSRFLDKNDALEFHHIIPDAYLRLHWKGDADPVANFAVLTESTNKALRDKLPHEVLERPDVQKTAFESAQIEKSWLEEAWALPDEGARIERFLTLRASRLEMLCCEAVGVDKPMDEIE